MEDGNLEMVTDTILSLIIALALIGTTASLFASARSYDKTISATANTKASSHYTLAYGNDQYYIPASSVLTDIVNEQEGVEIRVNGNTLNAEYIEKVRNHGLDAYAEIQSYLGQSRYKKIPVFNSAGEVVAINYEGGH